MTEVFFIVIGFFLLGISCGSFCGVLLEEGIRDRSFWTGRSQCPSCRKNLHWYELIPLVSYVIQLGRCRGCQKSIPTWVFHIEWVMGLVWMIFGTLLILEGYSLAFVTLHLLLLSFVVILALADLRSFTIPDNLSLPMIATTLVMVLLLEHYSIETWLIPTARFALIGGIVGMLFYSLQIMIPGILYAWREKNYRIMAEVLTLPFFFPFWMIVKMFLGEKRADKWIPSISAIDNVPTWVGGGDIRLGLLIGMIAGPIYFWWVVGI